MKLLLQTFGWVLVLLGIVAPVGLVYVQSEYRDEVDTYQETYQSFGSLEEEDRDELLNHLDFMVSSRTKAKNALRKGGAQ